VQSYEPFGELTSTTQPCGTQTTVAYNTGAADLGLPISITSAPIGQVDGTTRQPTTSYQYDAYGDTTSVNLGSGAFTVTYDAGNLGRIIQGTDPDGVSSYMCYNPNGSIEVAITAAQHAAGASCSPGLWQPGTYAYYDLDGNQTSVTTWYGNNAGSTLRWYDGADRVVEAMLPVWNGTNTNSGWVGWGTANYAEPNEDVTFWGDGSNNTPTENPEPNWMERYKYDLSINGQPSDANAPEYGNLYLVQDYLAQLTSNGAFSQYAWEETKALDTDGVGRTLAEYNPEITANATTPTIQYKYDGSGQAGFVSEVVKSGISGTRTFTYNEIGLATQVSTNDNGPLDSETAQYDADANPTNAASSSSTIATSFGYTYDAAGDMLSKTEAPTSYNDMPSQFTYNYYPDGLRETLGVTPSPGSTASVALNAPNLLSYAYRADGKMSYMGVAPNQYASGGTTLGCVAYSYTAAGRLTTRRDLDTPSYSCNSLSRLPSARKAAQMPRLQGRSVSVASGVPPAGSAYPRSTNGALNLVSVNNPLNPSSKVAPTSATATSPEAAIRLPMSLPSTIPAPYLTRPLQLSYDPYGRVASETLPSGGQYTGLQYDDEDEVTQFSGYSALTDTTEFPGMNAVYAYSVRGELSNSHYYASTVTSNFGLNFDKTWPHSSQGVSGEIYQQIDFDTINITQNVGIGYRSRTAAPNPYDVVPAWETLTPYGNCTNYPTSQISWIPDGEGRDASGTAFTAGPNTGVACDPSDGGIFYNGTASRTYDFDDHMLTAMYPGLNYWPASGFNPTCDYSGNWTVFTDTTISYLWGPDGHPLRNSYVQDGQPFRTTPSGQAVTPVMHWDGDELLFTSTGNGTVESVHANQDLDVNSAETFIVRDRNWEGSIVQSHDGTGMSAWQPPSLFELNCSQPGAPPMTTGYDSPQDPMIVQNDANGYFDGVVEFQGNRTYDPQMQRFTTPDTLFGILGDPKSFHAYDWNNGNPITNSDPSGNNPPPYTGTVLTGGLPFCWGPSCTPQGYSSLGPFGEAVSNILDQVDGHQEFRIIFSSEPMWKKGLAGLSLAFMFPGLEEFKPLELGAAAGLEGLEKGGVYVLMDGAVVKYVGRTNDFIRRTEEHANTIGREGLELVRIFFAGSKDEQRAVEQSLIEYFGGPKGGQLLNRRNELAVGKDTYRRLMSEYGSSGTDAIQSVLRAIEARK
jgi:RHS repeat-associated protein